MVANSGPERVVKLSNPSKSLDLSLVPSHGLTFHRLVANGYDVLIGPEDPSCFKTERRKFNNQIVGRYANRLPAGKSDIATRNPGEIVKVDLEARAPGVYSHGGQDGFDLRNWESISKEESQLFKEADFVKSANDAGSAIFRLYSDPGDQGFPEKLVIEVYVAVTDSESPSAENDTSIGQVYYNIRAMIVPSPEASGASGPGPTPLNITVHWGFNLESGHPCETSLLWMESPYVNDLDPSTSLSKGTYTAVKDGPFDFTSPRAIGQAMPDKGYDDNFLLNMDKVKSGQDVVKLGSLSCPISLSFASNQSSVMCYTANFNDGTGTRKSAHGDTNKGYGKLESVYLEFHQPVGTLLLPKLQEYSGTDTLLYPGEVYENWVRLNVKDSRPKP